MDRVTAFLEKLIESLELPDPSDRHILAAAIRSNADVIATRNLKDFPQDRLDPYGIEAQHPDTFITHLFDLDPGAVVGAAREHRTSLKNPPKSVDEFLETLERQGLTQTVAQLRRLRERALRPEGRDSPPRSSKAWSSPSSAGGINPQPPDHPRKPLCGKSLHRLQSITSII